MPQGRNQLCVDCCLIKHTLSFVVFTYKHTHAHTHTLTKGGKPAWEKVRFNYIHTYSSNEGSHREQLSERLWNNNVSSVCMCFCVWVLACVCVCGFFLIIHQCRACSVLLKNMLFSCSAAVCTDIVPVCLCVRVLCTCCLLLGWSSIAKSFHRSLYSPN